MAQISQSRPAESASFQAKVLKIVEVDPSSLGNPDR
jgi:hypothetical protein